MKTEDALMLRCPFCGGNRLFAGECGRKYDDDERSKPIFKVQCRNCGVRTKHFDNQADAIKSWNSRPISLDEGKTFPKRVEHPELVQLWDDMTSVRIIIWDDDLKDKLVTDLKWNVHTLVNEDGEECERFTFISLADIAEQIQATGYNSTIMVIAEDPLRGTIYRYGNYADGEWYEVGTLCGYA